jgi:aromatic-L-amino-acid decarboxylase
MPVKQDEFRDWSLRAANWGADYRAGLRDRPVRAQTEPGAIGATVPATPPEQAEPMEAIFADFEANIMPGMTHWQHPRFFAYFPANAAPASVVAEYLVSAIAAQCMLWQTSPAATELETRMLDWLRQAFGLSEKFSGVIQDSASSATLVSVLTMRERALSWRGNQAGLAAHPTLRIYASEEAHSSIDRALWASGIGQDNLVRVPTTGASRAMDSTVLNERIVADAEAGYRPAGIIATVGGTSIGATDDVAAVCAVAKNHDLFVHVDAAWAGSAMICPEYRGHWAGTDGADSIVVNPHKWLGAQFDCSAYFVRDPESLVKTLAIQPEYLKTHGKDGVVNFSEWSLPLGRRFRALKIWFLLRAYGLEGLRAMIRNHVAWSQALAARLAAEDDFMLVSEPMLSLFAFRYEPKTGAQDLDALNLALVERINDDGRIYLTQTRVDGAVAIRFQVGQFDCTEADVAQAFDVICACARSLTP